MALMSASDYSKLSSSKAAEKSGLANQAAQKSSSTPTSSARPTSSGSLSSDPRSSSSSSSNSSSSSSYASQLASARPVVSQTGVSSSNAGSNVNYAMPATSNKKYNPFETIYTGKDQYGDYSINAAHSLMRNDYAGSFGGVNDLNKNYVQGEMNKNDSALLDSFAKSNPSWWSGGSSSLSSDPRQPSLSSVYTPPQNSTSGTMTPQSGYVKNPAVDALPLQQQLDYYKQHPDEARKEILRSKTVYDQRSGTGDATGANLAHLWAENLRQATGISDSDTSYGNNNGIDSTTQRQTTAGLLNDPRFMDTGTGSGSTGSGTGPGTVANHPVSSYDRIMSSFKDNLAAFTQMTNSGRDQKLAGLAGLDDIINQNAVKDLNSNDVLANQRLQALKENMANAGLSASGDNVSAQVGLGNAQQQGVNDINTNKGNQLKQVLAQRNAINDNASADNLSLLQQLSATRDTQLLNDAYNQRDFDYSAGQDTIKNDRQSKVDNWNAYMESVGLTGNLGTGAKADWALLGGTDGAMTLDAKTKYLQQEGVKLNNEMAKLQLADYPQEQKLKMQQLQKQIDQIGKAPYQSAQDIEYDKIKLDTAKEQLNQLTNGKPDKPQTAEDFTKDINSKPGVITKDLMGNEVVNKDAAEDAILLTPLSDYEKYRLYVQYNIKDRWPADQIPKAPGK
jgi:hypothetical protein